MLTIGNWRAGVLGALAVCVGCGSQGGSGALAPVHDAGAPDTSSPSQDAGEPQDAGAPQDAGDDGSFPPFDAAPTGAPAPSVMPPPAHGALFGAFAEIKGEGDTVTQSEQYFGSEESLIGRRWVIDNRFYDDHGDWANDRTKWDIAQHIVPLITWMPSGNGDPLNEILAGKHDAAITSQAQSAKALGAQILLRWGHEMNGNWYPWSGSSNGGADAGAAGGPAKFVAAWKHVHDIFTKAGATNVIWIWCIIVTDVPAAPWNHWTNYYPGDDYVDWVGLDAYNWGSSSSCCVWQSFGDLIDASYQDYAARKPIMLPETASAEVGGNKGAWIDDMHHAIESKYTDIKAVVWFDIDKETDWRVASSTPTLAAYRAMGLDPYFNP